MAVVGFEFNKINVDKKSALKGDVSINNNVKITDVKRSDLVVGPNKQPGLKFEFEYESAYEPDFAKIVLGGSVLFIGPEDLVKETVEGWGKEKKVKKELMAVILNNVLDKCNVQSLILSSTTNLPPPIRMPKVEVKKD
ncbi:hypothetical protein HOK51_02600 [Candidatus Woesearchaeota archaeon]|jgi:hypothetical protein|nr:hypothetical protein [Candidatus Woesearchaeota archaeon]MBT6518708.1 hypothetical protein [Candidatus Woesearchaeota archaeon]MBT7368370.1 hypothetical protein [Candidatus Woesearchaeota archaeon]